MEDARLELRIDPGVAIGPVGLGMTLEEVTAAVAGLPSSMSRHTYRAYGDKPWHRDLTQHGRAFFFDNALQVEFDANRRAEHVGISSHPGLRVTLDGIDVFDTGARALWKRAARLADEPARSFDRAGGRFDRIGLVLWEADAQYDKVRGTRPMFAQVAVVARK